MATEVSAPAMPQLQSVQKAMAIPTVGAAVGQVGALYTRVKGAHSMLEWALSWGEAGVSLAAQAAQAAAPLAAPLVAAGDQRLAAAIAAMEQRLPIISEQPQVIVDTTRQAVMTKISPHVHKVCGAKEAATQRVQSLKQLSWSRANALLSTAAGQRALHGVDQGAAIAWQLLDQYLPPPPAQSDPHQQPSVVAAQTEIVPMQSDPALHTVQTVRRLSSAAARRVWANLAYHLHELRNSDTGKGIEMDVRRYIAALLAAVHLASVTSEQQRRESETEEPAGGRQKEMATAPAAPASPPQPQPTVRTTAQVVKTTPEAKSKVTKNGEGPTKPEQ